MDEKNVEQLKKLKGATGKERSKSKAKRMGIKSTIVTERGIAINSFIETIGVSGKKVPNVEVFSSPDGECIYQSNYKALKRAEIEPEIIQVYTADETTRLFNPAKRLGADYIDIKDELEEKFFGKKFPADNLHVQIAYNVLDIKKHIIQFVNQIIYTFYNINRTTIDYESFQDLIGTIFTFRRYSELDFSKVKNLDELDKLLDGVSFYDAYFPGVFKFPKKKENEQVTDKVREECKDHNFNVLRLLSLVRQACEHEDLRNGAADVMLYDLKGGLHGENQELLKFLDELYQKVPASFNKGFVKNSANNLYMLSKIYPNVPLDDLVKKYYFYVAIKSQNNIGVNLRLARDIIIEKYMPTLKDKCYDTARSKLYTLLGFVLFESVKDNKLVAGTVDRLRKNETEEGRLQIYVDFADTAWGLYNKQLKNTVQVFSEELKNKFNSVLEKSLSVQGKDYALGKQNVSYFSKQILLLTKFLDAKEINILLTGLISRFDNIADLIDCANECGVQVSFKKRYALFNDARAVSNELRIIKNVARMKTEETTVKNCMLIDAANFLGLKQPILQWCECTTDEQRAVNKAFLGRIQPPAQKGEKINHQLRNFIINNVVKSRWFFYLARYTKPSVCRKIMKDERLIQFVLKEIPDTQIVRYYKSVSGYDPKDAFIARDYLMKRLRNFTVDELFSEVESLTVQENRSMHDMSKKQKSRALVRLYLTVAYLAIKGVTSVNTVFSIAFSCLERDLTLKQGLQKEDFLSFTRYYVERDGALVRKYNQIRDRIRDDASLSREEKRKEYAQLIPILKNMHYDLHSYYCVRNNYEEARAIIRNVGKTQISLSKRYRDVVAHLNVAAKLDKYLGEMQTITSYYSIYVYSLERMLIDEQLAFVNKINDALSQFILKCSSRIQKRGGYDRDMLWVINAPFAYNLARYKNLSIEDLFYGRPTLQGLEKVGEEKKTVAMKETAPKEYQEGTVVIMSSVQRTVRGGLRGYIQGSEIKVNVSPKALKNKNASVYENSSVKVVITRWDANANAYNAELY